MNTRWTESVDRLSPLPEYPRPQLVRGSWLSLNGEWEYAITGDKVIPESFDGTILVPFSPEAPLSGVEKARGRRVSVVPTRGRAAGELCRQTHDPALRRR